MTFSKKIIATGHSLAITIPTTILRAWDLKKGDEIIVKIIKKVEKEKVDKGEGFGF